MRWGNSYLFLLLLLLPIWGGFFIWSNWRQKRLLKKFCEEKFLSKLIPDYSFVRRLVRQALWLLAFLFFVVALAEPKWGYHFEEVVRKGSDLIIAVDVSNSMLAEDIKPNRLERVKRKIYDLLQMAKGDRIGLVAFAGKAILLCPLTLDYQAVDQFLESLNTDLIPVQGTDFTGALQIALKSFKDSKNSKAILLFTDGEDHGPELQSVLKELKEKNIPLYILGVGTPEGAPIPLPKGQGGFKRDEAGNVVVSKLNEKALANLALATGGEYVRSVTSDADLTELYAKGLKGALTGSEIKSGKKRVYETRFQWPLGFALLFLLAEFFVGERKRDSEGRLFSRKPTAVLKSFILFLFILNGLFFAWPAQAGVLSWFEKYQGKRAYQKNNYGEAQNYFSKSLVDDPKDLNSAYNLGNSYYKGGDYLKAAESYAKASQSKDPLLKERALYNLGNSFYKAGEWEKSIAAYEQALKVDSKDQEAQLNLEFVKKKLEEKKKQQSTAPQNSQGENKKQNSGDQNSDQSGDQSSSGEQNQNPQQNQNSQNSQQNSGESSQKDSQNPEQNNQNSQNQNQENSNSQQDPQNKQNSQDQKQDSEQKQNQNQNQNQNSSQGQGDDQKQDSQKNPSNANPQQNEQNSQKPEGKLEGKDSSTPQNQNPNQNPGNSGQTMKPEEAKALLDSVQEDASTILKGQVIQKLGKTKRVEKDW